MLGTMEIYSVAEGGFEVTTDRSNLNIARIHKYLSEESSWAKGIPLEVFLRSMRHSLCFSAFDGEHQAGFVRVITDYSTFGYLTDLVVFPEFRGRSLQIAMVKALYSHPELQYVRRFLIDSKDPPEIFAKVGFMAVKPERKWLERFNPSSYL